MKTTSPEAIKALVQRMGAACRLGEKDAEASKFTSTEYEDKDLQAAYEIGRSRKQKTAPGNIE